MENVSCYHVDAYTRLVYELSWQEPLGNLLKEYCGSSQCVVLNSPLAANTARIHARHIASYVL